MYISEMYSDSDLFQGEAMEVVIDFTVVILEIDVQFTLEKHFT